MAIRLPLPGAGKEDVETEALMGGAGDTRPGRAHKKPFYWDKIVALVLVGLIVLAARTNIGNSKHRSGPEYVKISESMEWEEMKEGFGDITPSEKLEWHPCFSGFKCARLTVAMDYNRPLDVSNDNPKVHVALLLVPGQIHRLTGQPSKSPLLLNPGGPGGSGTGFAIAFGKSLHQLVGLDQDIIGFDPRGIGETTPLVDCYTFPLGKPGEEPSQEDTTRGFVNRILWMLSGLEIGLVNSSSDSLSKVDARARVGVNMCEKKDALYGENSIIRHVSTPAVARDMLSIIDAWDVWVDGMADKAIAIDKDEAVTHEEVAEDSSLDTKGKLVFLGISYGTLLGATFASMFPDRVGRVVLDGVVDGDFYVSPIWAESLLDTDNAEASFFGYCYKAGGRCALYRPSDSEADIRERYLYALRKLKENPIKGVSPVTLTPSIITYDIIKTVIFSSLYNPTQAFPGLAQLIDLLYRGADNVLLSIFTIATTYVYSHTCPTILPFGYQTSDAQLAIMCSDKRFPLNESIPDLQSRFENMANISSFADVWMYLMLGCSSYSIPATDPPMRWNPDPKHPSYSHHPVNTSFPLLFLSNTADPVTPLYAGLKMAHKFVDAGFIEQKCEGHSTLAAPSLCTALKVRAYFAHGKVPSSPQWSAEQKESYGKEGVWEQCESDDWPWKDWNENLGNANAGEEHVHQQVAAEGISEEKMQMLQALRKISERAAQMKWWGMNDPGVQLKRGIEVEALGAWSWEVKDTPPGADIDWRALATLADIGRGTIGDVHAEQKVQASLLSSDRDSRPL